MCVESESMRYNPSNKYSPLSMSHLHIVVPRNVPPENFLTVPETQKVRRTGVMRCVLIPVLVLIMVSGLLSCIIYEYHKKQVWTENHVHNEKEVLTENHVHGDLQVLTKNHIHDDKTALAENHVHDDPFISYRYREVSVDGNTTLYLRTPVVSPCSLSPCQGGGSCEPHDGTFTCYCVGGRGGQFCEKMMVGHSGHMVAHFSGQSYVRIRSVATGGPRTSIRIKIRPAMRDGVILYSSMYPGHNLSLALLGGHVQFRYHLGEDHLVLQSPQQVSLGSWHNLVLHTYHGDAMLKVDSDDPVMGSLEAGRITGLGAELVIGGVEGQEGYRGCLAGLKIGHQPVSLVSHREPLLVEREGVGECGDRGDKDYHT